MEVDIQTGRPLIDKQEDGREESKLQRQAQFAGVVESPAGQVLVDVLEKKLSARLVQLMGMDTEAMVYVQLLADLGRKRQWAEEAVSRLMDKKNVRA